jgi:CheY-like chemotaxis protein
MFGGLFGKKKGAVAAGPEISEPEVPEEAPPKILIIDDDPQLLELLTITLQRAIRCEIYTAATGQDAIQILSSMEMDLVVSDLAMPVVDGWTLFLWLAKNQPLLVHRFLLVSGALGNDPTALAIQSIGIKVLKKPFHGPEFVDACQELLGQPLPIANPVSAE